MNEQTPYLQKPVGWESSSERLREKINAIGDISGKTIEGTVLVPTDRGVVAAKHHEVATERVVGCAVFLALGLKDNLFIHLTPGSSLPYVDFDLGEGRIVPVAQQTADRIAADLRASGRDPSEYRGVVLSNTGSASHHSRFNYNKQNEKRREFAKALKSAGFGAVQSTELPLENSLILYSPERPNAVFVIGEKVSADDEWKADPKSVESMWISLTGDNSEQLVPGKPPLV